MKPVSRAFGHATAAPMVADASPPSHRAPLVTINCDARRAKSVIMYSSAFRIGVPLCNSFWFVRVETCEWQAKAGWAVVMTMLMTIMIMVMVLMSCILPLTSKATRQATDASLKVSDNEMITHYTLQTCAGGSLACDSRK